MARTPALAPARSHPTTPRATHQPLGDKEYNHGESTLPTPLTFHADGQCDAVALLCLQQAPAGGESSWVCAAAVHNELLRRGHARAVEVLMARGVWFRNRARYQDVPAGEEPWWEMPVFDFTGGCFSCHVAGHQYEVSWTRWVLGACVYGCMAGCLTKAGKGEGPAGVRWGCVKGQTRRKHATMPCC